MQDMVSFVSKTIQESGGSDMDKAKLADVSATLVSEVIQEVSAEAASEAAVEASSEAAAEAVAESGFGAPRFGGFR
jgi:hypothetical protein